MTIEAMREACEMEKWIWKWIAISTGVVGFILVFLTAYLETMSLFELIGVVAIGGAVLQVIFLSFRGLLAQLHRNEGESAANRTTLLGISLVALILLLIGQAYIGIPGFYSYFVVGAAVVAFGNSLYKYRSVNAPRVFVEIENDGNVLSLKRGEMLLDGLEAAGYRVLTQCGANGDCATCRVNLREVHQVITAENYGPVLTPRQQNEGWAISCKLPVLGDMKVRLFKPLVLRWAGSDRHGMSADARKLRAALPGFDCEACGYETCDQYAMALERGESSTTLCLPGGKAVSQSLERILSDSKPEQAELRSEAEVPNA